jgi:hypothetical protein
VEKELARRASGIISFLHVHGLHLIRARDDNLSHPPKSNIPSTTPPASISWAMVKSMPSQPGS